MIIKQVAFGNLKEAYVENRLTDKVNVIYSGENDRGKTVLFQSMMYALGNEPLFPSSFNKDDFLYYCKIEVENLEYEILRDKNSFVVRNSSELLRYDSVSSFTRGFFSKKVYSLPYYLRDDLPNLTELFLFYQLFFVPQDTRDTSSIFNSGYRTKKDFLSMLNSLLVPKDFIENPVKVESLKKERDKKKKQIASLLKKSEFLSQYESIASQVLPGISTETLNKIKADIESLQEQISSVERKVRREFSRKTKLDTLLTELDSLNKAIESGSVLCADCGSENIVYRQSDRVQFDLSNKIVRSEIKSSIRKEIEEKISNIQKYEEEKHSLERKLDDLLESTPEENSNLLLYRIEIAHAKEINENIEKIQREVSLIQQQLDAFDAEDKQRDSEIKIKRSQLLTDIINTFCSLDVGGKAKVDDFFTKSGKNLSGSEPSIFYFSKLYNFHKYLNLPFPLIIDSFREGEISTSKEDEILKYLISLNCQVILSATLKKQEEEAAKYTARTDLNSIDYSSYQENHILDSSYVNEFKGILNKFGIFTN